MSVTVDKDEQRTYMRPYCLLNGKNPRSPPILIHTNPLEILDLDLMKRPVGRDFQLNFQLMVVYRVRCHNFIHGARDFDREIIVYQESGRFRALDMSQLRPYDDRREMLRCVVDDG
jgi:hypothetical protein